jgi:hypothetical protein
MRRYVVPLALLVILLAGAVAAPVCARPGDPAASALAAIVYPGVKSAPTHFGVYLGEGLLLTNWHIWTLDGQFYTAASPPGRSLPRYTGDGIADPGEYLLERAECDGAWVPLAAAERGCTPYLRVEGAGLIFPLAGDDQIGRAHV